MTTLNISDLSVGDWVGFEMANLKIEGDDIATAFVKKVQQPARIKSILGDQDLILAEVDNVDNFGTIYLKLENISPVPITPEILEANGWQRNEEYEYMEYYGDPTSGIAHTNGTFHYRLEVPNVSAVCYFVHQLQHALSLAGVDKEINL